MDWARLRLPQVEVEVDGEKKHDGESDGDADAHKVELVSSNNFASYSTFGVVGQICPHMM